MEDLDKLFSNLNHDKRIDFARGAFKLIGQYCRDNKQYYIDIWDIAEQSGFHWISNDYNSPIPGKNEITRVAERGYLIDPALLGFSSEAQKDSFRHLAKYQAELAGIPFKPEKPNEFFWTNGMFPIADAFLYHAIIRQQQPQRIIEVGSGQSTLVALSALEKNGTGHVSCIEPHPNQFFNAHLEEIHRANFQLIVDELQNVPLSLFRELQKNDVLFIDSSHVVKTQSDLMYFFFGILPSLADGVLVHIHDIFLPYDYPLDFFTSHKRFFTEEYFLAAFLMHNSKFTTLYSNYYFLWKEYDFYLKEMSTLLNDVEKAAIRLGEKFDCSELYVLSEMPLRPHLMGGSFWMQS